MFTAGVLEKQKYQELVLLLDREQTCNIIAPARRDLSVTEHFSTTWIQMPAECVPWISTSTMPPRKPTAADDKVDPPRRSGRIASQPVADSEANPKPKAKVTKKRTAGEAKDDEGSSSKKVLNFFFFRFFGGYIN